MIVHSLLFFNLKSYNAICRPSLASRAGICPYASNKLPLVKGAVTLSASTIYHSYDKLGQTITPAQDGCDGPA